MSANNDALRILGARDGYVHALLRVRTEIGNINAWPIHPLHINKIANRNKHLEPLKRLEQWFAQRAEDCREEYRKRTQEDATL